MSNEVQSRTRPAISGPDWLSGKLDRDPEVAEIRSLCSRAGMPEVADRLIFAGLSLPEVRDTLIDALAAGNRTPALTG